MSKRRRYSANLELKGIAVILLYVLFGHPSAYLVFWERRDWYILGMGVMGFPLLVFWCV